MKMTLAALCYGDYPRLAQRCLDSVLVGLERGGYDLVADVRLGLNQVSAATRQVIDSFVAAVAPQIPVSLYIPGENVGKYPLMRRMIYDPNAPIEEWLMWFDDDSCLVDPQPTWWQKLQAVLVQKQPDMLGENFWVMPVEGRQWEWVKQQAWYNPQLTAPSKHRGRPVWRFVQGAWWVVRTELFHRWDWPSPEIHHNGGDSMLGELLRHQGYRTEKFAKGVWINANEAGANSRSPRRGLTQHKVGWDYKPGKQPSLAHQVFDLTIERRCPRHKATP